MMLQKITGVLLLLLGSLLLVIGFWHFAEQYQLLKTGTFPVLIAIGRAYSLVIGVICALFGVLVLTKGVQIFRAAARQR